jgi:high potential iron-sulfur protein
MISNVLSTTGPIKMNQILTRRILAKAALAAVAFAPLARLSVGTAFADPPALDPGDPTAKALGYVTKSTKPDSKCGNCAQFQGKAADATGPCTIFPGKSVASSGYCMSWAKKPA